jgi:hypothetical protein
VREALRNSFGDLRVRLDPWDIAYGGELPVDSEPVDTAEDVSLEVEVPLAAWTPIIPTAAPPPKSVFFVDGVRRAEARLLVGKDEEFCHGALGSFAVGAVLVRDSTATWHTQRVGRIAVLGSGLSLPSRLALGDALVYEAASATATDADAPLLTIHREMRMAEERLARELAEQLDALVVTDGPLTFGDLTRGRTIGFVKRLFKLYLPTTSQRVLRQLNVGQRSPLFAIKGAGRFARLSWFVRLAQPLPVDAELTGLVRLEVSEVVGVEMAVQLANATAALLPRFVPSRCRDPRAPQNLLPIGALEAHLRRRLGDIALIRRKLAALIARESVA